MMAGPKGVTVNVARNGHRMRSMQFAIRRDDCSGRRYMTNRMMLAVVLSSMVLAAIACGGGQQPASNEAAPAPEAQAPAGSTQPLEITLDESQPIKMGENTLQVIVMQGGQPVTDADVSVQFFMAAMPQMNMAEMKNTVPLKHEGGGRYRGTGNVMMAGKWDTTVMVMRGGQEIGSRKLEVTAQ